MQTLKQINSKKYYILINPDYFPREGNWLGAVISRHHSISAAMKAQDKIHKEVIQPITTAIWESHFMTPYDEYLSKKYCRGDKPIHVRTICKHSI